jgi:serine protease Do
MTERVKISRRRPARRRAVTGMALGGMLLFTVAPCGAQESAPSYADLIARILPSVVNITVQAEVTVTTDAGSDKPGINAAGQPRERVETMLGSGFIIDPSGYIVTNRHVVINSFSVVVALSNGNRLPARVVGHPPATDIALLKVNAPYPLPAIQWGDSDKVRVGDKVLAIGNPLGLGGTVTSGIVSALNRNGGNTPYDNYIQTDAAINHGNSGGPLFNMKGQVIGVDTILITNSSEGSIGLGLAIPSDDARFAAAEMREFGRVRPGWIGANLQAVTPDLAGAFGLPGTGGALVASVDGSGPSAAAGLKPGDIIETFNDQTPRDARALLRMIAEYPLDRTAHLTVHRGGTNLKMTVTIKQYPPAAMVANFPFRLANPPSMAAGDLGLRLIPITPAKRSQFGLGTDASGVEVSSVPSGSAADSAGLLQGDVILEVQDHPVRMVEDVQQSLQRAQQEHRPGLALFVRGPSGTRWVALPVTVPE